MKNLRLDFQNRIRIRAGVTGLQGRLIVSEDISPGVSGGGRESQQLPHYRRVEPRWSRTGRFGRGGRGRRGGLALLTYGFQRYV